MRNDQYELLNVFDDPAGEVLILTLTDRIVGNYGKLLVKNIGKLDGCHFVSAAMLMPISEFSRYFASDEVMDKELLSFFGEFCNKTKESLKKKTRNNPKGPRNRIPDSVGLYYEDVVRGLDFFADLSEDANIRNETIKKMRTTSDAKGWILSSIAYLRSHKNEFFEYILGKHHA